MSVEIQVASSERWDDVVAVMGEKGAYGGCWCMFWRQDNQEIHSQTADDNRATLQRLVTSGRPIGLLLYRDDRPVGWCQVAPRPDFWRLFHTRGLNMGNPDDASVWSITCVYVVPGARGNGAAGQLVQAAVEYAALQGASLIEAYPVADPSTGRKTQLSSGTMGMFSSAGFTTVSPPAGRRVLMRRMPPKVSEPDAATMR
jgi:GNAT superfamily N-acetyltransferase